MHKIQTYTYFPCSLHSSPTNQPRTMDDVPMPDARSTVPAEGNDEKYQRWLQRLMTSHEVLRNNPAAATVLRDFLNQIQAFHIQSGNHVLHCRGQQRSLLSPAQARSLSSSSMTATWFDFLQVSATARHSGPVLEQEVSLSTQKRRFETLSLKCRASREKARFGVTDDTGYLFSCLQHFVPRACFLVTDHYKQHHHIPAKVFIVHGNKKFAGQGDDASEEEGTSSHTNTNTDLHNPPPKCFPGTEHLKPSYYIFTWKANGKNAGVFGYQDPHDQTKVWLFVNSKGVCECAGLLNDVMRKDPQQAEHQTWSETLQQEPKETCLLPHIFQAFYDIWNYPGVDQKSILSLWERGYLLLFEFCDNKHVVLERGDGGRPVDHLAFIGLVQQPPMYSMDTYNAGLAFHIENQFSFEFWKRAVQAPSFSSKPTEYVKVDDLERALQDLMKGTFFQTSASSTPTEPNDTQSWYNPDNQIPGEATFATGEGAVCYEMANTSKSGSDVIRQLFKAKTASYITHRQFRAFLSRRNEGGPSSFDELHERVKKFCRQKFGDLNPESPYPDVKTFCQDPPSLIVEAASMYYAHFGMWLQEMASKLNTTEATLVDFIHPDILVSVDSNVGKEYQLILKLLGLPVSPVQTMLRIRCGMAFRVAEFTQIFGLQHAKVFAAPREILEQIKALEVATSPPSFVWETMPTGYSGTIHVGFQHAFPDGAAPNNTMGKAKRKKQKREKKKQGHNDVLSPFRAVFSRFLLANPGVKLTLGRENPQLFTFISTAEKDTLLSCATADELQEKLTKLPCFKSPGSASKAKESKAQRSMSEPEAVAQAVSVLQREFTSIQELFHKPTCLTFGDVFGHLLPVISPSVAKNHMLIIRGYPGLGKSTIAKALQQLFGNDGVSVVEADSFFGPHCPFSFDLLTAAHDDAQCRARAALEDLNTRLVVISNTNTTAWEYSSYIRIAQESNIPVLVAILTLDTNASIKDIDNIHDVPAEKVQKMALRLRQVDNNPEGKTLDQILAIADAQMAKSGAVPDPVLAWALLESSGKSTICDIWEAFIRFSSSENILVSSRVCRAEDPHVTQLYVRSSSSMEELAAASSLWDQHGSYQSIKLGEIRFRTVMEGTQRKFTNMAVCVASITPELVAIQTPHITIAHDPDHAKAVDSNKLWLTKDAESQQNGASVAVFDYQPQQSEFNSVFEIGTYKNYVIRHEQLPYWLKG